MRFRYLKLLLVFFILSSSLEAKPQFFREGLNFYNNKKFDEAKFKFEQDLVLNPKNELSYLYLSKIFKNLKKKKLEEQNLNTVILLNPKNEDAIYSLARLKLESSDYKKSKELNDKLMSLCDKFCKQSQKLKIEIENLSKK
tara:strand:+ start:238 stop:660 length:423 start_codon:yes stop_codon:yes gene_type:complete